MSAMPILVALWLAGSAADSRPDAAYPGAEAPLLPVDRFSDTAGTILRRSRLKDLPGPNEPIRLDDPRFVVDIAGAGGRKSHCYDLDVRPSTPARLYVFYDEIGNYKLGQFPVVDVAPGDPGYTDLWDVWKVTVPAGFKINSLRDRAAVERLLSDPASGYTAAPTGVLVNGPIVPEGSSASMKAGGGGRTSLLYLWYNGSRAAYLYFEGSIIAEGAEGAEGAGRTAPVSSMSVASRAFEPGSGMTATVAALPGDKGYSPLRRVLGPSGEPAVDGLLNCPAVGN